MAALNIFNFVQLDQSNIHLKRNYSYQFEAYLKNLEYKKIIDIGQMLLMFTLYMIIAILIMNLLNPAIS